MNAKQEDACWGVFGLILFCGLVSLPFLKLMGIL